MDLISGKQQVDSWIQLGAKKRLPFRLIARKLPKATAQERIRKARTERHSRANHDEQYYQLLEYEIFLTNVPKSWLTAKQVAQLYALRWYIEILFKSWKSYANFKQMLEQKRMSYHRTLITIYLLLIQFVYFTQNIYRYIKAKVSQATNRSISMLKYMDLINSLCSQLLGIQTWQQLDPWLAQFIRHATYEKRTKRKNMKEKYLYFKRTTYLQLANLTPIRPVGDRLWKVRRACLRLPPGRQGFLPLSRTKFAVLSRLTGF